MTIASSVSRNDYIGSGSTATYSFAFKIFSNSDLLVTIRDTDDLEATLVLDTDYTVTGAGDSGGGTIVLQDLSQDWIDASGFLDSDFILSIRRVRPLTQSTDIRNQGEFFPETHENAFDHFVMIDQKQQDEIDRSPKLAESIDPADFDTTLPADIASNPGSMVLVNDDGDGFVMGPDASNIAAAQAAATTATAAAAAAATLDQGNNQNLVSNLSIDVSLAGNAMTITTKGAGGTALSASNVASINTRSGTLTSGAYNLKQATSSYSLTIPSTATLGQSNGVAAKIYVYAIDEGGTIRLAVSGKDYFDINNVVSSTAMSTGADAASVLYSEFGGSNIPAKLIAVITNTQATAGTWATTPSLIETVGCNEVASTASLTGLTMDSTGANAIAATITSTGTGSLVSTATAANANTLATKVTRATGTSVGTGGVAISSSCGTFSTSSTSFVDVTNLSVTIITSGRPVFVGLMPTTGATSCYIQIYGSNANNDPNIHFQILQGASPIGTVIAAAKFLTSADSGTGDHRMTIMPGGISIVDIPAAGTYTYKLQTKVLAGTYLSVLESIKLVAYEL